MMTRRMEPLPGSEATVLGLLAGRDGDAALIEADRSAALSYGELADEVWTLAGKLAAAGLARGDRVALVLPDGPQFVRFLLAAVSLGAAAAPLNPAYTQEEFAFYLDDLQPKLILLPAGELAAARRAAGSRRLLDVDSEEFLSLRPIAPEPAAPDDVALVLHTSGTTSRPKQVPLAQRNLAASARGVAAFYALTRSDVSFCAMPLFHVHGLVASILAPLATGGSAVVPARFVPGRFIRHAREHGVTWFSAGPTLHGMILDKHQGAPIETLRFARSCSSALAPELLDRCEATYGVPMLEAYGMTEASHQIASNPLPPAARKHGSVGLPSHGIEIRIVDSDGRDVEVGEVAIRGPGLTAGYVSNPVANAEAFFDAGWFRTGDRGRLDEDGYLVLEGRLKELIIRGGENISPFEV